MGRTGAGVRKCKRPGVRLTLGRGCSAFTQIYPGYKQRLHRPGSFDIGENNTDMKHKLSYVFAAGLLATGLAFTQTQTPAPAGPPERPGRPGARMDRQQRMAKHFERIATELNLTPQQREQAKALMQKARTDAQPVKEQLRTNRQQLGEAIKSGNQAEITRISNQVGQLTGQLTAIHARAMQQGYAMLTPEQRQKAEQLRGQWMQRFGRHHHGPAAK